MDVGLVCDGCDTFNPMGTRQCSRCGAPLGLSPARTGVSAGRPVAPVKDQPTAPRLSASQAAMLARVSSQGAARSSGETPAAAPRSSRETPAIESARICGVCGATVPSTNRFCGACGSAVSATSPAAPMLGGREGKADRRTLFFGAMQQARAKLVLIKGDGLDGVSFTLAGQEHLCGRVDAPLLFADDPFLSPIHANFFYRNGRLLVRDENSLNGVFLRIRGSHEVQAGARFLIGEQVVEVQGTPPDGDALEPTADGTYFFASPQRPSRFRLIQLLRGGDTGLGYRANADNVTLGREGNDINFPEDPFISGHHARVEHTAGRLMLVDLGSKNGTFLRSSTEAELSHGDYIFMGQQLLRVEIV